MRRLIWPLLLGCACTDASLYDATQPPIEADRLALTGRVCTEDPDAARFPVKLVIVADHANGPLFSEFDPGGRRVEVLTHVVRSLLARPGFSLAVVGYAGQGVRFAPAPDEGSFTRNPGVLLNAITRLSIPAGCIGEALCRDYDDGLRAAGALIEDDLAATPAGERVLTQYVVLLINAGEAEPLAPRRACCSPGDRACRDDGAPSSSCQVVRDVARVTEIRETVMAAGASFRLHALQLAAADEEANARVAQGHAQMAFAGSGRSLRFAAAAGIDLAAAGLFDREGALRAKSLVVANVNAIPAPGGPVPDSDGDGLSDEAERSLGTPPDRRDGDGDGVGDYVEILVDSDPAVAALPTVCERLDDPHADQDLDGLTDCEEALLGTDRSLVDTDGDALPDRLEVALGTDYLHADGVADTDDDGVPNVDEVRERTDPRTADAAARLGAAYRYAVDDEGVVVEPVTEPLQRLLGVEIAHVSAGTTAGVGTLRWVPGAPARMAWRDAGDPMFGPLVEVPADGEYTLGSASYAEIQGEQGPFVRVVVRLAEAPPTELGEDVRVLFRARQCFAYTVRNVRLMDTLPVEGRPEGGLNRLFIYFAQAPAGQPLTPGPFRQAQVPVKYVPPDFRDPWGARLVVGDDEFVGAHPD